MRTTVNLDADVAAAVEGLRREGLGVSEAVNRLARAGLGRRDPRPPYVHRSTALGLTMDVRNVAEVLETLDRS